MVMINRETRLTDSIVLQANLMIEKMLQCVTDQVYSNLVEKDKWRGSPWERAFEIQLLRAGW